MEIFSQKFWKTVTSLSPIVLEINNASYCTWHTIILFLSADIHVYVNIASSQSWGIFCLVTCLMPFT